jgi:hypothetical protein
MAIAPHTNAPTRRANVARVNQRTDLGPILSGLVPFANTTYSLCGERVGAIRPVIAHSSLSRQHRAAFHVDDAVSGIDYIVWSYGTPIAWHHAGGWAMPDARYSRTTSCHQGQVRRGLRCLFGKVSA